MRIWIILLLLTQLCHANVHIGPGYPFANIQSAADKGAIHAGDTVFLHSGSYRGYQGVSSLKGTAQGWIVICPFENTNHDISGTWQFMSCEYIKFVGLIFRGNAANPGRLLSIDNSGSCSTESLHITVDSCSFSHVNDSTAITAFKFAGVDHFEVTNNWFSDFPVCDAMDYNVCHDGIIRGNHFENCLSAGHIKGGASDIVMERNLFINASQASWVVFELGGDTGAQYYCPADSFEVQNLKFQSNIIVGGYRGLALSSAVNCQVINNTFYNCGQATMRFLTTSRLYPTLSGNLVANNIFAFGDAAYMNGGKQGAKAATLSTNIYYSKSFARFTGPYWDTPDLDSIREKNALIYGADTPMFKDTAGLDFHLVSASPAITTGSSFAAPQFDFYGNAFSTNRRSIGAIQYQSLNAVDESASSTLEFILAPNPALHHESVTVTSEQFIRSNILYNVYDCIGARVASGVLSNGHSVIDIAQLHSGMYVVSFFNESTGAAMAARMLTILY